MQRNCFACGLALAVLSIAIATTPGGRIAQAAPQAESKPANQDEKSLSPAERMKRRFPQPIRVGDLVGLPMLDGRDSTLGFIEQVVRTPSGSIVLIVSYRGWLGWAPFDWGRRPVGVPLEAVAILGRQVAALDFSREQFAAAPPFAAGEGVPLAPGDTIAIAVTRR